ncbi:HAD family hydrolase [Candidatus Micrarchaeota archaeon]|nr:HAD family hydrolase [Candidatus Micrarchaeota archaeon]
MYKNVIFDWSGTLSNDQILVYTATMNAFKKINIETISFEEYRRIYELPYMKFYRKFDKVRSKEEIDKLFLIEFEKLGSPKPFPGAESLLKKLKQKNINCILLSSHLSKELNLEVDQNGFREYFSEVNGSVHDKVSEINKIMKRNNFTPEETVYVGDMTHDVDAGKHAGVKVVAVTYGYQTREQLQTANPDYIVDTMKELEKRVIDK